MDAIFYKKNIISLFLLAICGLCFIGLYVFLASWLLNFGAYLHIEGDTYESAIDLPEEFEAFIDITDVM